MIRSFLDMLFGSEPQGSLAELRWKPPGEGMRREFHPVDSPDLPDAIGKLAYQADTYIGVAPRKRTEPQTGGREAVVRSHVLWADCDTLESVEKLKRFTPQPAMVIESGSGGCHAYWPIDPISSKHLARANRRIALALGADLKATDPARILRPPGTRNFKHNPPKPVTVAHMDPYVLSAKDVVGGLPDPAIERPAPTTARVPQTELELIPPADYFHRLTGQAPNREGMVLCPVPGHQDTVPSCYLYETAQEGWCCFGCMRGGTIYHLAGHLWGIEPKGPGFLEIKARLGREFGLVAA